MADHKNHFDEDHFEDIYSSSGKDEFEDIFSDSERAGASREEDLYEDFSSGREDMDAVQEPETFNIQIPQHREINLNPEVKPYSYNYDKSAEKKARRISEDMGFDDISGGKQPKGVGPKKKSRHVGLKVTAAVLVVVFLFVGVAGFYGYSKINNLLDKVNYQPLAANQHIAASELASSDAVKNILLIGVDARTGQEADETRSDTMMIVSIDTQNKQLKLTSILRDTYVEIPGWKWNKINAAQSHGGRQLLVDTIEYNFKVDIDNYMLVNFDMFITIIDKLGGIDVEVTEKEAKYINSKDEMTIREAQAFPEDIQAGQVHFDGMQALWYSRIRYLDSDFNRTKRQRKVITQLLQKVKGTDFSELYALAESIMPMVETDLTSKEILTIGMNAFKYIQYDLVQMQVPAEGTWKSAKKNVGSVLTIDLEKNISALNTFIYQKAAVEPEKETTKK